MSGWASRRLADSQRAKGDRKEYVYELQRASDEETDSDQFNGSVLLRLEMEPHPFRGAANAHQLPEGTWKYLVRTRQRNQLTGDTVSEPFSGEVPFAVTGLGPWDRHPEGGFDPDELAAKLLNYLADWRNPTDALTAEQREWFRYFGPAISAAMPQDGSQAAWVRGLRSPQE